MHMVGMGAPFWVKERARPSGIQAFLALLKQEGVNPGPNASLPGAAVEAEANVGLWRWCVEVEILPETRYEACRTPGLDEFPSELLSVTGGSCHKYHFFHVFCRDKSMLVVTKVLSRKSLKCLSRQNIFVATKLLSRKAYFCHDKHVFSRRNFCHDKHTFVATKKVYLWQLPPMISFIHSYCLMVCPPLSRSFAVILQLQLDGFFCCHLAAAVG